MISNDQNFDEFCRRNHLGELATKGNTDPSVFRLSEAFSLSSNKLRDYFCDGLRRHFDKSVQIHVGFCANPTLNAFAARDDEGPYLIGINTGAFVKLANVYEKAFVQTPLFGDELHFGEARNTFSREKILSQIGFLAAYHFLFSHELGHIAYGHADLLRNGHEGEGPHPLFEANTTPTSTSIPPELFQSMEVDADLYASTSTIAALRRRSLCGLDLNYYGASEPDLLKVALTAILIMFHTFYGRAVSIDDYRAKSHPLPEIRLTKFLIRLSQLQSTEGEVKIRDDSGSILRKIEFKIPEQLRSSMFPAMRLEGKINMINEAIRIRANEDRYEKRLSAHGLIPVGAVLS